jgi:hypothetical protein
MKFTLWFIGDPASKKNESVGWREGEKKGGRKRYPQWLDIPRILFHLFYLLLWFFLLVTMQLSTVMEP